MKSRLDPCAFYPEYERFRISNQFELQKTADYVEKTNERYLLPSVHALYFYNVAKAASNVSKVHFQLLSQADPHASNWLTLEESSAQITEQGNIVIVFPNGLVTPGPYQYRLSVYDENGKELQLDSALVSTKDNAGYVITGTCLIGTGNHRYVATGPCISSEPFRPEQPRALDLNDKSVAITDPLGNKKQTLYGGYPRKPIAELSAPIPITEADGSQTTTTAMTARVCDGRNHVVTEAKGRGSIDKNGNWQLTQAKTTEHDLNALGKTLATSIAGVAQHFVVEPVSGANTDLYVPLPHDKGFAHHHHELTPNGLTAAYTGPTNDDSSELITERYTHDHGHRVATQDAKQQISRHNLNGQGTVLESYLPEGQTTLTEHDRHQLPVKISSRPNKYDLTDQSTQTITRDPFGNKIAYIDLSGVIGTLKLNGLKAPSRITEDYHGLPAPHGKHYLSPGKNTGEVPPKHQEYHYNEAGLLMLVIDHSVAQRTAYLHDAAGNRLGEWVLDQDGTVYMQCLRQLDARGLLAKIRDVRYVAYYDADEFGNKRRVKVYAHPDGEKSVVQEAWFDYDDANNMVIAGGILKDGHIEIIDGQGLKLAYDQGYRVIEETQRSGKRTLRHLSYGYAGLLSGTHRDSDNLNQIYAYDVNRQRKQERQYHDSLKNFAATMQDDVVLLADDAATVLPSTTTGSSVSSALSGVLTSPLSAASSTWDQLFGQRKASSNNVLSANADTAANDDDKDHGTCYVYDNNAWQESFTCTDKDGNVSEIWTTNGFYSDGSPEGAHVHYPSDHTIDDDLTNHYLGFTSRRLALVTGKRRIKHGREETHAQAEQTFNANGVPESVYGIADGSFRFFISTHEGCLVVKYSGVKDGEQAFYFTDPNGRPIGKITPKGLETADNTTLDAFKYKIDFTLNAKPIDEHFPATPPAKYKVQSKDAGRTFLDLAESQYGSESFAEALAMVNGYQADDQLPVGDTLDMPAYVGAAKNWLGHYAHYSEGDIDPAPYPAIPMPRLKQPHHSYFWDYIAIAISVIVSIIVPALAPLLASYWGAALVAVAADMAYQCTEMIAGNQHGFSFTELAESVAIAVVSHGVSEEFSTAAKGSSTASTGSDAQTHAAAEHAITKASIKRATALAVARMAVRAAFSDGRLDWKNAVNDFAGSLADDKIGGNGTHKVSTTELGTEAAAKTAIAGLIVNGKLDWQMIGIQTAANTTGGKIGIPIADAINNSHHPEDHLHTGSHGGQHVATAAGSDHHRKNLLIANGPHGLSSDPDTARDPGLPSPYTNTQPPGSPSSTNGLSHGLERLATDAITLKSHSPPSSTQLSLLDAIESRAAYDATIASLLLAGQQQALGNSASSASAQRSSASHIAATQLSSTSLAALAASSDDGAFNQALLSALNNSTHGANQTAFLAGYENTLRADPTETQLSATRAAALSDLADHPSHFGDLVTAAKTTLQEVGHEVDKVEAELHNLSNPAPAAQAAAKGALAADGLMAATAAASVATLAVGSAANKFSRLFEATTADAAASASVSSRTAATASTRAAAASRSATSASATTAAAQTTSSASTLARSLKKLFDVRQSSVGRLRMREGNIPNLSTTEEDFYSKAQLIGHYDYLHPGQLPNEMAGTFIGSRYESYQLLDDVILQRGGTKLKAFGQSFSFEKPISELQLRIDKAVMPVWPTGGTSPIDTGFSFQIPKGSIVHLGNVANQGKIFMGGTRQVVVQAPWTIPDIKIVNTYPLQEEALWNEMINQLKR